jgi:FkbM family methyltransferase
MRLIKLLITNPFLFAYKAYRKVIWYYKLYILKDIYPVEVTRWFKDKGDETLMFEYPELNEDSLVFDVGGYHGDFAKKINDKYGCKVYVFEPHPEFYKICLDKFEQNEKVIPLNYGLSDKGGVFTISDSLDASSFVHPNHKNKVGIECQVKEIFKAIDELKISHIDLMKINIEGSEYSLLIHMANKNKLSLVSQYQIQFHDFVNGASLKRDQIIDALSKTHQRSWCYTFVWENWKIK